MLELDAGEVFAHSFGGAGSYARFREARSSWFPTLPVLAGGPPGWAGTP